MVEEKAKSRLSFAATGAVIEAPPQHTSEAARRVSDVDVPHAWRHLGGYDASDSEHEQLDWRGQHGDVGRYTGEESEPDSSGGDTDGDCISERMAAFEAQRVRKARHERGVHAIAEANARIEKAADLSGRCNVRGMPGWRRRCIKVVTAIERV